MKNKLTKNIGLKIVSVVAAFLLWLVVINVDDPVISKTYTGINVELINADALTEMNKDYEVIDNSDMITVVVTAKRSVIDEMSKDYIKATADVKSMTFKDTVPIDVRSTRYSDRIDSVTTRAESVKLKVEDIVEKSVPVAVDYSGNIADRFVLTGVDTNIDNVLITGPESLVAKVSAVVAQVDVSNINKDTVVTQELFAFDEDLEPVDETKLKFSRKNVDVTFLIDAIKEIPIESGYSGVPAAGYVDTGLVKIEPSKVLVTGRGENYSDLKSVNIAPNEVKIDGASGDVVKSIDISEFLPSGVTYYDKDFDAVVQVSVEVKAAQRKVIEVPLSNITVDNLPEGYIANIVDIGGSVEVEVQGLGDTFDRLRGDLVLGKIDAKTLVPRNILPDGELAPLTTGENDGIVSFELANGISVVNPVNLMVIVDYVGNMGVVPNENIIVDDENAQDVLLETGSEGTVEAAEANESVAEDNTVTEENGETHSN